MFVGMQDHTAESIKSLEGFRIAWAEEAQTLSAKSLELLRPTIRAPGSQIWFSWNPRNRLDAVDKFLRGDDVPEGAAVMQVNYDSNPWFPKELEAERALDQRMRPDGTATSGKATMSPRRSALYGPCETSTKGVSVRCLTIYPAS